MKIVGIVIEANPFHNGHKYFIDQIKELINPDYIIAVVSSSFTMRGEISLIDKFEKTKYLLNTGIDIVMELPITMALQSGDYFSYNAVNILSKMGINILAWGSETDDLEKYNMFYNVINSNNFKDLFKSKYDNSKSYKINMSNLLKESKIDVTDVELFNKPNFTLGLQYYSFIKDNNLNINPYVIKRNDSIINSNASNLRKRLLNGDSISNDLPLDENIIDANQSYKNLNILINYALKNHNSTIDKEGILNNLRKNRQIDYLKLPSSAKYSNSRLRRILLSNLLEIDKYDHLENYLRILGAKKLSLKYLNSLDKEIKKTIFSSPNELEKENIQNRLLKYELKASELYEQITNREIIYTEYKLPIKVD